MHGQARSLQSALSRTLAILCLLIPWRALLVMACTVFGVSLAYPAMTSLTLLQMRVPHDLSGIAYRWAMEGALVTAAVIMALLAGLPMIPIRAVLMPFLGGLPMSAPRSVDIEKQCRRFIQATDCPLPHPLVGVLRCGWSSTIPPTRTTSRCWTV